MGSKRTVRLSDVAAAAGVSIGTVSKALNGNGELSSATRERVRETARRLGFRPNQVARSLVTGRSYIVGVLSTDPYGRFTLPILTGAEDTFGPGQISMLLAESRGDPIREQHYLETLVGRGVDGIMVAGGSSDPREPISQRIDVPTVYALSPSTDSNDVSVVPDDQGGAERAIQHLAGTGKRSIAVVTGARKHEAAKHRADGARTAMESLGLGIVGGDALYGAWTERWGYEAAERLLAGPAFDGIFCGNDQIARGVVDALRSHNVAIPADVGVVGVDNWSVIVEAARPPITSIDLNLRHVGSRAAELLIEQICEQDVTPGVHTVDCFLVPRQST